MTSNLHCVAFEVVGIRHPQRSSAPIRIERSWNRAEAVANGAIVLYPEIPADWSEMWCIRLDGMVLGQRKAYGGWEWELQPSSRTWAFIKRTRFPSAQAAHEFLQKKYARSGK